MILTATRTNEARFAPWTRVRPGWPAMGDPCGADEGGSRPPHSVVGARTGDPESFARSRRTRVFEYGAARDPEGATEGRTRNYLPRLPLYVSRRGCRTDELSERGCRDGSRVPSKWPVREEAVARGGVDALLPRRRARGVGSFGSPGVRTEGSGRLICKSWRRGGRRAEPPYERPSCEVKWACGWIIF
jgi:hypothetical protein